MQTQELRKPAEILETLMALISSGFCHWLNGLSWSVIRRHIGRIP